MRVGVASCAGMHAVGVCAATVPPCMLALVAWAAQGQLVRAACGECKAFEQLHAHRPRLLIALCLVHAVPNLPVCVQVAC